MPAGKYQAVFTSSQSTVCTLLEQAWVIGSMCEDLLHDGRPAFSMKTKTLDTLTKSTDTTRGSVGKALIVVQLRTS